MAKWSESKPWERREDESAKAFEAFEIYLHMGDNRSLSKVAQRLHKSKTMLGRWSSRYEWQIRVVKYENELRREEYDRLKKERKRIRDKQLKLSDLLQRKAMDALKNLDPEELPPKTILSFITQAAKMENYAMDSAINESALESGSDGRKSSLADEIVEAYRKRQEAEE